MQPSYNPPCNKRSRLSDGGKLPSFAADLFCSPVREAVEIVHEYWVAKRQAIIQKQVGCINSHLDYSCAVV